MGWYIDVYGDGILSITDLYSLPSSQTSTVRPLLSILHSLTHSLSLSLSLSLTHSPLIRQVGPEGFVLVRETTLSQSSRKRETFAASRAASIK